MLFALLNSAAQDNVPIADTYKHTVVLLRSLYLSTWRDIAAYVIGSLIGSLIVIVAVWIIFGFIDIPDLVVLTFDNGGNPEEVAQVNAIAILNSYQSNETLADKQYKGKWFRVRLENVDKIEAGGKVKKRTDSFDDIVLDFRDDNDVLKLRPGQSMEAFCKLSRYEWGDLQFRYCRWL